MEHAGHLYECRGFRMKDRHYEDICLHYHELGARSTPKAGDEPPAVLGPRPVLCTIDGITRISAKVNQNPSLCFREPLTKSSALSADFLLTAQCFFYFTINPAGSFQELLE